MTESEMSYSLVQVIATIEWTQLATKFVSNCCCPCQQPANTEPQTTATSKLFDFMSDTTVHTAGERSIKTENHGVSRDFQRFLDSAAIELNVFFNLQPQPIALQLFYAPCSSARQVFSQARLIVRSTKS